MESIDLFAPRKTLTVADLRHCGACVDGIFAFIRDFDVRGAAICAEEALRLSRYTHREARRCIRQAAQITGQGHGGLIGGALYDGELPFRALNGYATDWWAGLGGPGGGESDMGPKRWENAAMGYHGGSGPRGGGRGDGETCLDEASAPYSAWDALRDSEVYFELP